MLSLMLIEVAAVPQPRTRRRDVVGGALALRLQQHRQLGRSPCRPTPGTAPAAAAARVRARRRPSTSLRRSAGGRNPDSPRVEAAGGQLVGRAGGSSFTSLAVRRRERCRVSGVERRAARPAPSRSPISGEPMNDSVSALPSLRAGKLRLNDDDDRVRLALPDVVALPLADARTARVREHGARRSPRASASSPSRSIVARTCSRARRDEQRRLAPSGPLRCAWRATSRGAPDVLVGRVGARARPARTLMLVAGSLLLHAAAASVGDRARQVGRVRTDDVRLERRRGRSRSTRSIEPFRGRPRPRGRRAGARRARRRDRPAPRARWPRRYAAMRLVVREERASSRRARRPCCRSSPCRCRRSTRVPGPKYSTIAPVPPFTVRMPASLRMTSFGAVQPRELAGELDADHASGCCSSHGKPGHHVDRVRAADADRDHAEPARVRRVASRCRSSSRRGTRSSRARPGG